MSRANLYLELQRIFCHLDGTFWILAPSRHVVAKSGVLVPREDSLQRYNEVVLFSRGPDWAYRRYQLINLNSLRAVQIFRAPLTSDSQIGLADCSQLHCKAFNHFR